MRVVLGVVMGWVRQRGEIVISKAKEGLWTRGYNLRGSASASASAASRAASCSITISSSVRFLPGRGSGQGCR